MSEVTGKRPIEIILIDDEIEIITLFNFYFRKEIDNNEVRITPFLNGAEGLKFIESAKSLKDKIVLSDINMPVMDGLELLENLKDKFPALNVIMLTAYASENYVNKANSIGADGFFTKPVDFNELKPYVFKLAN